MRSSIKQLIIGMTVATGLSAVGVSVIGGAVAQSVAEEAQREPVLTNRHESSVSETDFQLAARQQLQRYFFK